MTLPEKLTPREQDVFFRQPMLKCMRVNDYFQHRSLLSLNEIIAAMYAASNERHESVSFHSQNQPG